MNRLRYLGLALLVVGVQASAYVVDPITTTTPHLSAKCSAAQAAEDQAFERVKEHALLELARKFIQKYPHASSVREYNDANERANEVCSSLEAQ